MNSLIIKRGGHEDQLSQAAGLDKYRIKSLKKLIDSEMLSATQTGAAVATLIEKCAIFANGCRKRGRADEAKYYEELAGRYPMTEDRGRKTDDRGQKTDDRRQMREDRGQIFEVGMRKGPTVD